MFKKKQEGVLLARVNFPIFVVKVISERHILVAGGGGSSRTGVNNSIEIYELTNCSKSKTCKAYRVAHHDTDRCAIMNGEVFQSGKYYLLAGGGMNGVCEIFKIKLCVINEKSNLNLNLSLSSSFSGHNKDEANCKQRKSDKLNNGNSSNFANHQPKKDTDNSILQPSANDVKTVINSFKIESISHFQADFKAKDGEESFLKVVRYNPVLRLIITGGSDGHVRVWKYPDSKKLYDIQAHKDEVDDIDINPSGTQIVSVSRDGHGYIWNTSDGSKFAELEYQLPVIKNSTTPLKYNIRACRFGIVENNFSDIRLFTLMNPVVRSNPPNFSYICKWNTNKYIIEKINSIGPEITSAMAITDDGRFVGVGTLSGSVEIYVAFSLQRVYRMDNSHKIFVTGLEFLKTCPETQLLTGDNDTSLISVSIDNHIVVHSIPKLTTIGFMSSIIAFLITMLAIYFLLDFLGL